MNSPQMPDAAEFGANEIQKLWFATQRRAWLSLAVVPATPGLSVVPLAQALARMGETCLERSIHLLLAEGADFHSALRMLAKMNNQVSQGNCVVVALDSVLQNAAGIPLMSAADACLLGIALGRSCFDEVGRTVEVVGASRFVGVVALPLPDKPSAARAVSNPPGASSPSGVVQR